MNFLDAELRRQLLHNGHRDNRDFDHQPVVRLLLAGSKAQWLLSSLDPDDEDTAFGLCDLGTGFPELGYVSLQELEALDGKDGLQLAQDCFFSGKFPLSIYAKAASLVGHITEDTHLLSIGQELPPPTINNNNLYSADERPKNVQDAVVTSSLQLPDLPQPDAVKRFTSVPQIDVSYRSPPDLSERPKVNNASAAYAVLMSLWDDNKLDLQEQVNMLVLNHAKRVLGFVPLSTGGANFTAYDTRLITVIALKANAASIVIAHNHPSGNLTPSSADKIMTAVLLKALQTVGIKLDDHLIVTRQGFYSFSDEDEPALSSRYDAPNSAAAFRP